jgi:hypothetical protein
MTGTNAIKSSIAQNIASFQPSEDFTPRYKTSAEKSARDLPRGEFIFIVIYDLQKDDLAASVHKQ